MSKILGLDLGTNSIGWAVVDKDGTEMSLLDTGVRIFSEGVKSEKGIESSRAAERTAFRSARKIKFRRKLRKFETLKVLAQNNMCPLSTDEVLDWRKSGFKNYPLKKDFLMWLRTDDENNINPYFLRDKASREKVTPYELGRALYHMTQRRGFLSNRLDQSAEGIFEEHAPQIESLIDDLQTIEELKSEIHDYFIEKTDIIDETKKGGFKNDLDEGEKKLKTLFNSLNAMIKKNEKDFEKAKTELIERLNKKDDLGAVKQKIHEISDEMKKGNFATLGQYFYSLYNKGKIRNQYTAREEHYLSEFEIICTTQQVNEINENEIIPEKRYQGLAKDLYKAIFYQRPLKSQKGLIGRCTFEKNKSRCAVSHPDYEEFRMWNYINTIKIKTPQDQELRFLTQEERIKIVPKFHRKKDHFNFEDIAKELFPKGASYGFYKSHEALTFHYLFNYKPYDSVPGSPVSASFRNLFGNTWKTINFSYQTKNSKGLVVTRNADYRDLWHLLTVSKTNAYLYEYAKTKLKVDDKTAKSFSKIKLKKDFSSLSLNAINKIVPYLKSGLLYSHAVFMANIENIVDTEIWSNPKERAYIQEKIGQIIDQYSHEKSLIEIINGLIKGYKNENVYYSSEAEPYFKADLEKRLIAFFGKKTDHKLDNALLNEQFTILIEQIKQQKFLPIKRLDEKVINFLLGVNENGDVFCTNKDKIKKLFHPSDIDVFKTQYIKDENGNEQPVLGSPITGSIKNPMAMRALHQMRKVLNNLILENQIDSKTIIHIEMARELNDANKRKGIKKFQDENKVNREKFRTEIKVNYKAETGKDIEPTDDDLLRYQLWIEQDKTEIYEDTGKSIGISQIIGNNPEYDIEHTIPRSRSQDNSQMNKTLCSQRFNRDIKRNMMPSELTNHTIIKARVDHWRKEALELSWKIDQLSKSISALSDKNAKDKKIAERHFLSLKRDYLQGKYDRFTWKEPKVGFKNSQIPDTGIITRYAQAYLKSYFTRVESVKGGMVAEFRKIWGIQKSYIENDKKYFETKDRSKHTHHAIDAITIACMTKDKYDALAHAWTKEDEAQKHEARKILSDSKPWKTFTEDLVKIEEKIAVSHYTPDVVKKQSKKIIRVKGIKQYKIETIKDPSGKTVPKQDAKGKYIFVLDDNGNKIPRYQQGDTIRGSLHQDSLYGAIQHPIHNERNYVIRKDLYSIKKTDIENIVDPIVQEKIVEAVNNGIIVLSSNTQQKNKVDGTVWMNQEKQIPIKKVRVVATSVKNPLEIKNHATLSQSRFDYKQKVYAQNDENYAMAIYELEGKREFELISTYHFSQLRKSGHGFYPLYKEKIVKGASIQIPIAKRNGHDLVLKRGQQVVFFDKETENPLDVNDISDFTGRIYIIEGLSIQRIKSGDKILEYGVIMLRYFKEARKSEDLKQTNYKPDGVFKLGENKPTRKMNHNQFDAFLEGIDFQILPSGKIINIY